MKQTSNFFSRLSVRGIGSLPLRLSFLVLLACCASATAQTTAFTYQGKLADTNGTPLSGNYDFQFKLFDALSNGNPIGTTLTFDGNGANLPFVSVANGIFTVTLDFVNCTGCNCPSCFNGAARFLEIAVKPHGGGTFPEPLPRQPITSTPYAVKSMNAANATTADGLSVACVNCVTSSHIASVNGSAVTGTIPVASVPAGSSNYIQNSTTPQPLANFDVSSGHFSGSVRIEGSGFIVADTPSLSLSSNGSLKVDAPFLPGGRFTILENGNVGIGNGAPTITLDVVGDARVTGNGTVTENFGVGAISAGSKLNVTGSGIVRARINSDSNGGLSLALADQPKWSIATVTGGDLQLFNDANGQLAMSVNGNTNVISGNGSGLTNVTAQTTQNSSLLALLRWDLLSRRSSATGSNPQAIAFDGANVWIANRDSNNVTKIRASDGAILGNFPVGSQPNDIAFDGSNIWVANQSSNNVTKLRASDGANLGNFAAGSSPRRVAFDGANIWVSNQSSNNVTKLRASDGANLGTFAVGTTPQGVAFDGANIWVANSNSQNVTKLQSSDGANLGTFPVGSHPSAVAFDGENVWVATGSGTNKLRASDGSDLGTVNFASGGALAFDGANLWIVNQFGAIGRVRTSDSVLLGTFTFGTAPRGAAFDGANIWIASSESNTVTKFPIFP